MQKSITLCLCLALILSIYFGHFPPLTASAQSQSTSNISSGMESERRNEVTVRATANVDVSNSTLDTKDKMLRNAVIGFINSGPNVLKKTPTDQPVVKTKIINQIINATQSVEGIEATSAVIAVEITKGLKGLITASSKPNQSAIITLETSSTCKLIGLNISCENTVTIK